MVLQACSTTESVLRFCLGEPIRYRHLVHALRPVAPMLTATMAGPAPAKARYWLDDARHPTLLACRRGDALQLEGELGQVDEAALAAWCRALASAKVRTSHEPLRDLLTEALGVPHWEQSSQYTVTADALRARITRPVRVLGPGDADKWERFVRLHTAEPIMATAARDFEWMAAGLPVSIYVTENDDTITGVLTSYPLTEFCDEISMMYVDLEHRRRGNAHSLLSEATHDIHNRGRLPGYSAMGDRAELRRMLTTVGFVFIAVAYEAALG
jgi:GNAT superfamily N-acetyltransferase